MSAEEISAEADIPLVYIPDHADQARRRLLSQDWDAPRIVALFESLGVGVQTLEDVTFDVLLSLDVNTATGEQLDRLGALVGEQRGGLGDEDLRRFIRARILVNVCDGTADAIIEIWRTITYPYESVRFATLEMGSYVLEVVRKTPLDTRLRRRIRRMMNDVRPAGRSMELVEAAPAPVVFDGDERGLGYDAGVYARVL